MSWTDKCAMKTINDIRFFYNSSTLVETGTFMGVNAEAHRNNFNKIVTIEINPEFFEKAKKRLSKYKNIEQVLGLSSAVLANRTFDGTPIYYLDAHFYNPKGPRWVIQKELEALQGHSKERDCVIIIHDFNNGLGHCTYDGERLGMNVVGDLLKKVNSNFHYYTNNMDFVDIMKPGETKDPVIKDNLTYAWKTPRLTYRGILYATPTELPKDIKLVKWDGTKSGK